MTLFFQFHTMQQHIIVSSTWLSMELVLLCENLNSKSLNFHGYTHPSAGNPVRVSNHRKENEFSKSHQLRVRQRQPILSLNYRFLLLLSFYRFLCLCPYKSFSNNAAALKLLASCQSSQIRINSSLDRKQRITKQLCGQLDAARQAFEKLLW